MTRARAAVLCLTVLLLSAPAQAQQPPELTGPVNDFAGVVDSSATAALEDIIRKLQAASGDVIVVATVKTFQPAADIRVYANEMFENKGKGIGRKARDNGMLVLLAVDDREVWAEVGYDLESIITDGFAGQTSRQTMVPFFKQGDYGGGLLAGVRVFAERIAAARGVTLEGLPAEQPAAPPSGGGFPPVFLLILLDCDHQRRPRHHERADGWPTRAAPERPLGEHGRSVRRGIRRLAHGRRWRLERRRRFRRRLWRFRGRQQRGRRRRRFLVIIRI